MANNRMILLCNVCKPDSSWKYHEKGVFALTKWYPASTENGIDTDGAYYTNQNPRDLGEKFLRFLTEHQHLEKFPGGNEHPVRLEYEC